MDLSKLPSDFDLSDIEFECSFTHPLNSDKKTRNGYCYDFILSISNFIFKGKNYFFERYFHTRVYEDKVGKWGVKFHLKTCVSFGQDRGSIYNYFLLEEPTIENHKVYLDIFSKNKEHWGDLTKEQIFDTTIIKVMSLEDRQIILPVLLKIYADIFSFISEKEIVAFSLQGIRDFLDMELEKAQATVEQCLEQKEKITLLMGE